MGRTWPRVAISRVRIVTTMKKVKVSDMGIRELAEFVMQLA